MDIKNEVTKAFNKAGTGFAIRYSVQFHKAPDYCAIHDAFIKAVKNVRLSGLIMIAELELKAWLAYYQGASEGGAI